MKAKSTIRHHNGDFSVTQTTDINMLIQYLQLFIDILSEAVGSTKIKQP